MGSSRSKKFNYWKQINSYCLQQTNRKSIQKILFLDHVIFVIMTIILQLSQKNSAGIILETKGSV